MGKASWTNEALQCQYRATNVACIGMSKGIDRPALGRDKAYDGAKYSLAFFSNIFDLHLEVKIVTCSKLSK